MFLCLPTSKGWWRFGFLFWNFLGVCFFIVYLQKMFGWCCFRLRIMLVFLINLFFLGFLNSFRVFQFYTRFTGEDGTAVGEGSCLVGLFSVQFALVIGQWQWTTVFNQFQQSGEIAKKNYLIFVWILSGDNIMELTLRDLLHFVRKLSDHRMVSIPMICQLQR